MATRPIRLNPLIKVHRDRETECRVQLAELASEIKKLQEALRTVQGEHNDVQRELEQLADSEE